MGDYLAHLDALWLGALLAMPVSLGVLIACRVGVRSPATRHALWLVALLAFIAPAIVASTALPSALRDWTTTIADLLPERPFPTDAPAASATPHDDTPTTERADPKPAAPTIAKDARTPVSQSAAPTEPKPQNVCPQPAPSQGACAPSNEAEPEAGAETTIASDLSGPSTPSLGERVARQTAPWIAGVGEAASSLRQVPPLPPLIWLGGIAVFTALLLARLMFDRRVTRLALPATPPERAALRQASATIGLRRPPELLFVPNRVSPMVTCGFRKRLVMPRSLWRVLDADARQAVLLHELAHIRRRDHWVHWLSLAVGALYWWHPLVWVIRARLRDEADLCCDAWVTALRPERRRGYAETLLKTTAFLNVPGAQRCAAGLAMASPTKRKLARRITMVMTHTVRPKLSVHGSSIVAGVALLALLVMPGVACPPAEKSAPKSPEFKVLPAAPGSTFERHMRDQQGQSDQSIREKKAKLQKLETEAAAVRDRLSHIARVTPDAPEPPRVGISRSPARVAPAVPELAATDGKLSRAYHMPKGRLSALTELMVRADVPVLVSPEGSRLVVHATRAQHQTFADFARMICPEGVKITTEDGEPIADGLTMRQGMFADAPRVNRELAIARAHEARSSSQHAIERGTLFAKRTEMLHKRRAIEAQRDELRRHAEGVERDAERIYRDAERRFIDAERLHDKAESRRDKADHYKEKGAYEKAATYAAEADELHAKSEALERQAEDLERQAEIIQRQAEEIERQAEAVEREAEKLEAMAEAYEDQIEDLEDQHDEADHDHDHDDHDHEH